MSREIKTLKKEKQDTTTQSVTAQIEAADWQRQYHELAAKECWQAWSSDRSGPRIVQRGEEVRLLGVQVEPVKGYFSGLDKAVGVSKEGAGDIERGVGVGVGRCRIIPHPEEIEDRRLKCASQYHIVVKKVKKWWRRKTEPLLETIMHMSIDEPIIQTVLRYHLYSLLLVTSTSIAHCRPVLLLHTYNRFSLTGSYTSSTIYSYCPGQLPAWSDR